MNLDDLSAEDLALIDEVCLEFERALRVAAPVTIESALDMYRDRKGGSVDPKHRELIRQELQAIELELSGKPLQSDEVSDSEGSNGVTDTLWATPSGSDSSQVSDSPSAANERARSKSKPRKVDRPSELRGTVGPYEISEVIARGGMGVVYRATDPRLGRPVAIKTLWLAELSQFPSKRKELVERFEREARAVASLSHPNIVELFDVGITEEQPYAVMEFIDGSTLAERLTEGKLTIEQTRHLGMQVAGALATSHAAGVIHRDLKPQNIILVHDELHKDDSGLVIPRAKLVDFGLSRLSDAPVAADGDDSATRAGMILGTPGYMSPEQARGEAATSAADIFGLGCVLYEALYGRRAIQGETPVDRLAATLRGSIEFEPAACETSAMLCELIQKCVAQDPKGRPTASDLYAQFRKADLHPTMQSDDKTAAQHKDAAFAPTTPASDVLSVSRRHAMTAFAGGAIGSLFGGFSQTTVPVDLSKIESIAVLTFENTETRSGNNREQSGQPLGNRMISKEEILSSAIVNELSKVEGLAVLPYRSQTGRTPEEWRRVGERLGVDALLVGSIDIGSGQWLLDWQLVAPDTGNVMVDGRFVIEKSRASVVSKAEVAADVAAKIGRYVITSSQLDEPPNPDAYECLVKGKAYSDGDSTEGLLLAMRCFNKAHDEDDGLVEPLASIALVSLNLASRSDSKQGTQENVARALEAIQAAIKIDESDLDVQLAQAMYEWQVALDFEFVKLFFENEDTRKRYDWQFLHQKGLYLAALDRGDEAIKSLQRASTINPMSMLVRTDLMRVEWFYGWDTKVGREAEALWGQLDNSDPGKALVTGLLIDFHEEKLQYEEACRFIDVNAVDTREAYFESRKERLSTVPYGPFGFDLNQAIFNLRMGVSNANLLSELRDSNSPMFPLLLTCHPAFFDLKASPEASQFLPVPSA
ncbi:MAG: protein kinase [Planctomycetota bacterium]